ncbi:MAG: rhodanese-like domain-containing protein [Fidelibacterota bacterium]
MKNSSLGQGLILFLVSLVFSLGYNAVRNDGLPLVAVKEIVRSQDVSDVDAFLADTTFFTAPRMIDLALARELFDRGVTFVDARDDEEYRAGHIRGALNLPTVELVALLSPDDPVVAYCSGEGCASSLELAETLMLDWGFSRVFVFEGGWPQWESAGYPAEVGR